jgi:hypothetical protein
MLLEAHYLIYVMQEQTGSNDGMVMLKYVTAVFFNIT